MCTRKKEYFAFAAHGFLIRNANYYVMATKPCSFGLISVSFPF